MAKTIKNTAAQVEPSRKAYEMKAASRENHPPNFPGAIDAAACKPPTNPNGLHGRHDRILRRPEVEGRTGLSRSTIYEMMAEGTFPRPLRLGKRAVGWTEAAIAEWLASRDLAVA